MKGVITLTITMLCGFYSLSMANIAIDDLYDIWSEDKVTFSKTIHNDDPNKTAYVKIELVEVKNPLSDNKTEKTLLPKEMSESLFVTPSRLIIPPGQSKNIRFYYPKGRNKDEVSYYRVNMTPVAPKKEDGFALSDKELADNDGISAGVGITIGFSSILAVQPQNAFYKTTVSQKDEAIYIYNNGNAVIETEVKAKCKTNDSLKTGGVTVNHSYCNQQGVFEQKYKVYPQKNRVIDTSFLKENIEIQVFENGKNTQKQRYFLA
ncbi:hypothetical protein [Fastidiosibacter lacustris]|uniref:hypothetical protein n=1 Tax=Fastidiosibacter lacustris TaxID=2056695 RepID=UPI000E341C0F|nr:hypothetical protein [Fastidiosibacter lacustris]